MPLAEVLNKQQLHKFEELQEDDFEGYFEAGESRPLIPDGTYKARCIKFEKGNYYGIPKIYLWFQITEPYQYEGTEIFMAMNAFKKVPAGSKYYEQWIIANDNIKPVRKERMTPLIFINHVFEVYVRTAKSKNNSIYSIIDYLKDKII